MTDRSTPDTANTAPAASEHLVVLVTAATLDDAKAIARRVVQDRHAACANLLPIQSIYWWDDAVQDDAEVLIVFKTHRAAFDALRASVLAAHSYTTPEIIGLPIVAGSQDYLRWITEEVHVNRTS